MQTFVGIDVSKNKLDVCVIFEDDKVRKKVVKNCEYGFASLTNWFTKLDIQDPHICMEATGSYSDGIASFLHNLNFRVSVVNPLMIKSFRNSKLVRKKTDSSDAHVVAAFCKQNKPNLWKPKDPNKKVLHELFCRMTSLKRGLAQIDNQLEKLNQIVVKSILKETEYIKNELKSLENALTTILQNNAVIKKEYNLISNIKGVGAKTALTIIANMPDVSCFKNSKQYVAFAGLSPSHFQSGTSVKCKSHISKIGSKNVRKVLFMSALCVIRHNSDFAQFVQKMKCRGKAPKVIIVAIMRKLLCLFFGMLKSKTNFDKNLAFPS